AELRLQTGTDVLVLDDRNDLRWGQNWIERVRESLDQEVFLIPVLTPLYFLSPQCREEYEAFADRERKLRRSDLILPLYYVGAPVLDDPGRRGSDKLAQEVVQRAWADWRDLRFEPLSALVVGRAVAKLAEKLA